ncbi:DUF6318 family protein [Actinomyces marmotae]|uniref:DUF6318 family protein n=1 Tax=Actinomyces marmotae TaxID=2737173 RepID=UPI0022A6F73C|nr:DUF6318 family protein [Actinomyces marmotae]
MAPRRRGAAPHPPDRRRQCLQTLTTRWARPITLVLLACCALAPGLLILTACAKDPTPPQTTATLPTQHTETPASTPASAAATPSASATPSLSPELAAQKATALAMPKPPMPAEATENTQQGAVRAAVHFIELYRYAFITGDTTDLAAMSEDRCTFCASAINAMTDLHDKGGWSNPWKLELTEFQYISPGEGKEYCGVRATMKSTESTSIRKGETVVVEPAEEKTLFLALRYYNDAWHVGEVSTE